jgi:hypothetical protein
MSTEDKQNKKGFFARLCEFFNGVEGSGCACHCLGRDVHGACAAVYELE